VTNNKPTSTQAALMLVMTLVPKADERVTSFLLN